MMRAPFLRSAQPQQKVSTWQPWGPQASRHIHSAGKQCNFTEFESEKRGKDDIDNTDHGDDAGRLQSVSTENRGFCRLCAGFPASWTLFASFPSNLQKLHMQLMGTSFRSFQLSHDAGKDGKDAFDYAKHDAGEDAFGYAEQDAGKVCEQTVL